MNSVESCPIQDDDVFVRDEHVISVSDTEVVRLFSPHSNTMTELLGCGPRVWDLLDGQRSVCGVVDELARVFDIARDVVSTDVKVFIGDLSARSMCKRTKWSA